MILKLMISCKLLKQGKFKSLKSKESQLMKRLFFLKIFTFGLKIPKHLIYMKHSLNLVMLNLSRSLISGLNRGSINA